MITKSQIQFLKSLQQKLERNKSKMFVGEGSRLVLDLLKTMPQNIRQLYCTESWFYDNETKLVHFPELVHILSKELLKKVSSLISNEDVVALFAYPLFHTDDFEDYSMSLYLEDIRDPGNMGTILRLADWYGIRKIYGTNTCVDIFNNKVIQASMSSIARVEFEAIDIVDLKLKFPQMIILGASLVGQDLKTYPDKTKTIVCIGNEAHGLSDRLKAECQTLISISAQKSLGAESLNAAIASGIFLQHFS
jgi:TrmH family RNA methyltransferase